ncbi:octanoyl-[acyl-carrier-protein]:protein N-octanoyltransferase LIPT2, mitochondrial-like [Convolutriloba macropyga]|uniref:octanoyl-[acyl-carrier-protein]:protein N-octanoyltransferase LIPT2, mitochondrial-like n=1 Tax=Convolutriloba macropyga TaxID=536237 RepID=UPI003F51CED5
MIIRQINLGKVNYRAALDLQYKIKQSVIASRSKDGTATQRPAETLITCQHDPPVYTVGNRTSMYSPEEARRLRSLGAEYVETNRGGLITFHGPGQLVVYPILDIKSRSVAVKHYVNTLEQIAVGVCERFGISTFLIPDSSKYTGVWVKATASVGNSQVRQNKICAFGVNASEGVTTHGLALNVNPDLRWFSHVVPCGLEDSGVTSIASELKDNKLTVADVLPVFIDEFVKAFKVRQFVS